MYKVGVTAMKQNNMKKSENKKTASPFDRLLNNDRFLSIIVMIGILGIALIFISSYLAPKSVDDSEDDYSDEPLQTTAAEQYRAEITEELGNMLASMDGVGRTKVMVTLSSTVRELYAADTDINDKQSSKKNNENENADQQNTEKKKYTIIRSRDGSEKALSIGQLVPEIKGVLVICDGGDDEEVQNNIIEAVSAALDISKSHICVSRLGGSST